jgi:hypothetical protein
MLAQFGAQLRAHGGEFIHQRFIGQVDPQCLPGTIQFDQPIGRNPSLLEQASRPVDQDPRLGEGFTFGDRRLPPRLRRAMQPLVVIAEFTHRLLERIFLRQACKRSELQLNAGRLMRQLQERAVVALCTTYLFPPGLLLRFRAPRRGLLTRPMRCRRGDRRRVFIEKLVEHALRAYLIAKTANRPDEFAHPCDLISNCGQASFSDLCVFFRQYP